MKQKNLIIHASHGLLSFLWWKKNNNLHFLLYFIVLRQESILLTSPVQPPVSEILYVAWKGAQMYHPRMRITLPFLSFSFSDWSLLWETLVGICGCSCSPLLPQQRAGLSGTSRWAALMLAQEMKASGQRQPQQSAGSSGQEQPARVSQRRDQSGSQRGSLQLQSREVLCYCSCSFFFFVFWTKVDCYSFK